MLTVLFQKVSSALRGTDYFDRTRIIFGKSYAYVCILITGFHVSNSKLKHNNIRTIASNIIKKTIEVIAAILIKQNNYKQIIQQWSCDSFWRNTAGIMDTSNDTLQQNTMDHSNKSKSISSLQEPSKTIIDTPDQ